MGVWRSLRFYGVLLLGPVVAMLAVSVPAVSANDSCTATRVEGAIEISWVDDGGRHVLRRDGDWLATPGANVSTYVDETPTVDPQYELRTRIAGQQTVRVCSGPIDPDDGAQCVATRMLDSVELSWVDDGGRFVLRRNGSWLATVGSGVSSYSDADAPPAATYELRTWEQGSSTIETCKTVEPAPGRQFVVHVSVDGLRADHVTPEFMPNLSGMVDAGASTMNARTDPAITKTLPNHTSQFTSRFVWGSSGHRVTVNSDPGVTVHDAAGRYVDSVFDVVHDHGGRTVMYVGKEKFEFHNRTWDGTNGAPDVVGEDDGRDKIDVFVRDDPVFTAPAFAADLVAGEGQTFGFFHIRSPDAAGHESNWLSPGYVDGVREADVVLGELVTELEQRGVLPATTFIVTSDHGGPLGLDDHSKASSPENYTVPFVVAGPGVAAGGDLYELNVGTRQDPGTSRPNKDGAQPVRPHEVGNLALDILGLPPITGSTANVLYDLKTS